MAVDLEKVNQVVRQFVAFASSKYPVERAILFGSYAKGTQHYCSDIDIALFLHDFGGRRSHEIAVKLYGPGDDLVPLSWDTYIEPHVFSSALLNSGDPFIEEILKTGLEIPLPTLGALPLETDNCRS